MCQSLLPFIRARYASEPAAIARPLALGALTGTAMLLKPAIGVFTILLAISWLRRFGWSEADFARIAQTHDLLIHCAATVRFDLTDEEYDAVNVAGGTTAWVEAEWKSPLGVVGLNNITTVCTFLAGTTTCTKTFVLGSNQYSGEYQLSYVTLESVLDSATNESWKTTYRGPGYGSGSGEVYGHGRGGVVGAWSGSCCHSLDMPTLTVE